MTQTYDIKLSVNDSDFTVELTRPSPFAVLFGSITIPDSLQEGRRPKTREEQEAYRTFAEEIIETVSDLPKKVAEYLSPEELARLFHACVHVYAGDDPSLDEFGEEEDESVTDAPDSSALAANAYPHFETSDDTQIGPCWDGYVYDGKTTGPDGDIIPGCVPEEEVDQTDVDDEPPVVARGE